MPNSSMLVLPVRTAPALRSFCTTVASNGERYSSEVAVSARLRALSRHSYSALHAHLAEFWMRRWLAPHLPLRTSL